MLWGVVCSRFVFLVYYMNEKKKRYVVSLKKSNKKFKLNCRIMVIIHALSFCLLLFFCLPVQTQYCTLLRCHHGDEFFVIDLAIAIDVGLANHFVHLLIG